MLINKTPVMQSVRILMPDGTRDSINLQPRGRATPPAGSTIDPKVYNSYAGVISGIDQYAPKQ